MTAAAANTEVGRPVPRPTVGLGALAFGVVAAPVAWWLALSSLFAVASHTCFPGTMPLVAPLWNSLWVLSVIAISALVVCAVSGLVSYRSWRESYGYRHSAERLVQFGEGRSRFLAAWGALTSLLFAILMIVSLIPLAVIPLCGP